MVHAPMLASRGQTETAAVHERPAPDLDPVARRIQVRYLTPVAVHGGPRDRTLKWRSVSARPTNLSFYGGAGLSAMTAVETLSVESWDEEPDSGPGSRALEALESGRVLFFPCLAFELTSDDLRLLGAAAGGGRSKNISFDSATGEVRGTDLAGEDAARLAALMKRFGDCAAGLLARIAPGYGPGLKRARASFRPSRIEGRETSWRKDDRRLHVDAFPSRPTHGKRILRVFSNADPEGGSRRWHVGEPFEEHARRFLPRLAAPVPGYAAILALAGLTRGRRSRYDQLMLQLHDAAKRDETYQSGGRHEVFDFPAGSTWMVYTDQVPHAAISGRYAFEQTFELDPAVMSEPARSPLRVLERLTHKTLA